MFPKDHGRLIFEATYKTALTNTVFEPKDSQRLDIYPDGISPQVKQRCSAAVHLQNASK